MSRGLLVVISGPGGVGKDTVIEILRRRNPSLRYSVSFTTRPRRPYEVDGVHYSFVDRSAFAGLVQQGALIEHATVDANLYGTSAARVEQGLQAGQDVVLKIDVQGAEQVRRRRPDGVFIFLAPPSMDELLRRRIGRGTESADVIESRQRLAEVEIAFADRYDHVVVNDDADRAVAEIESILRRQRRAGDDDGAG